MSDWNGKGDKSRVTNIRAYWDSPLWKKKETVNYNYERCLFLDDKNLFLDDKADASTLNNIDGEDNKKEDP